MFIELIESKILKMPKAKKGSKRVAADDKNAAAAALSPDRQENTPPYLKLIADCWEHILGYLRFEDMGSLGETCKRMHQMVTYYLRENFPDAPYMLIGSEVHLEQYHFSFPVEFSRFVSTLCISHGEWDYFLDAAVFRSLKTLMFLNNVIDQNHIRLTRAVLPNIEKLDFTRASFKQEIFDQMLDLCRSKLKTLNIDVGRVTGEFFLQHFPALENFKYTPPRWSSRQPMPELKIFLDKHEQLKRFGGGYKFLWVNRNSLRETSAKLEELSVDFHEYDDDLPFDQFIDFLKELHAREFFKAVQLTFNDNTVAYDFDELSPQLSPLASTLSGLSVLYTIHDSISDLSVLVNLKEIRFREFYCRNEEVEMIAKSLVKLEKLTIEQVHDGQILPFVRYSKALKTMHIHEYLSNTPIRLIELNQERKQLENAQPIVIFAPEYYIYLPTKWNSKYLNLDMVKMSRIGPIF